VFARFGNDHIHEFLPPIKEEMVDFL